ncbi:hypothetical protein [Streptomyces sp. CCM_MD2014]|jgi:hypothetical protein|uniref:hypothetical protein n=1 Tax=Streptomyces sp. CCM_MD2014 TaxID=1561022 RepID=UPI00052A8B46|nr:hypothetical protein [Streptomyces sp. CCM_MD2014]AIV37726.1 hypothetical protein NI25_32930 [Streptomyces sp. CCM_MD2014]
MEITETTHNQVALLALAWGVSESEAVQRLVEHFQRSSTPKKSDQRGMIDVYALYEGVRIEGLYDPATESVTVTNGPAQGRYKSPSGAAAAVLRAQNPKVSASRNGWSFWIIAETGSRLQTIRH